MTLPEMYQKEFNDPLGFYGPQPPVAVTNCTGAFHDPSYSSAPWNTTWSWRKSLAHNDLWASQVSQDVPTTTPWQVTKILSTLQVHDPWRTRRAHNEQSSHSWQPRAVHEEPPLPPPKPEGPEPVCSCNLPSLPTTEVTSPPLGFAAAALVPQFGPVPLPVVLRHCPTDIFEDFSTDGSNMDDELTYAGIGEQTALDRI